ncbi:hypothetical protein GGR57DRAFT_480448 [Xylariaceae sp. FL1272]|nr:hypothetical protein GGR57DRAFT_480448 [Xylariaceae sp. FL1272]
MDDEREGLQSGHKGAESLLFIVNGIAGSTPQNSVTHNANIGGRKRPHHKSRRGCLACKRRRVKCDERLPCSNCSKRREQCLHTTVPGNYEGTLNMASASPRSRIISDNVGINLLHLELLHHFQNNVISTLSFSDIWHHVLPRSFQEHYIMCAILCLSATHLSTLRPHTTRYSNAALELGGKSAALFRQKLSGSLTRQSSEGLIAVSILMHYTTWAYVVYSCKRSSSSQKVDGLSEYLSEDPLLQLSSGAHGLLCEAYHTLAGSNSVFLAAGLYSPRYAIEKAIIEIGSDPHRFANHFLMLWNTPCLQPPGNASARPHEEYPEPTLMSHLGESSRRQDLRHGQEDIGALARRLSLILCLVTLRLSSDTADCALAAFQPDIERLIFSFPVHYSGRLRRLAIIGDSRALIILYHFYHAARLLLTGPSTWWAQHRSKVVEDMLMGALTAKGLQSYIPVKDW